MDKEKKIEKTTENEDEELSKELHGMNNLDKELPIGDKLSITVKEKEKLGKELPVLIVSYWYLVAKI